MYTDNPLIQKILTLGEPRQSGHKGWPDYIKQFGVTAQDAPDLLALVEDVAIDSLTQDCSEVWAPVYAWRMLGQLGSTSAIKPLIKNFDRFCNDDYALGEVPLVIGMLGQNAIAPLVEHWQQTDKEEFSHIMAMDALCEIAIMHPPYRDQVLDVYRAYMRAPNTGMFLLNGLLMGRLLDLHATEALAEIRQLFALGCVDITCAGDLEDVEIDLGLRAKRSTPKPDLAQLYSLRNLSPQNTEPGNETNHSAFMAVDDDLDGNFDQLEHFLLQYGCDESVLSVSELDGFFAALACSPSTILPSVWLPVLWGGEQFKPQWQSADEFNHFTQLVFQHYNTVMGDFQTNEFEPLFLESTLVETELLIVDDWCEGFLRGLGLWEVLSEQDSTHLAHLLKPILQFYSDEYVADLLTMSDAQITTLQRKIKPAVIKIHRHFFKPLNRANSTVVNVAPKIGRNDPCPCGSGKKHKKCCGLH